MAEIIQSMMLSHNHDIINGISFLVIVGGNQVSSYVGYHVTSKSTYCQYSLLQSSGSEITTKLRFRQQLKYMLHRVQSADTCLHQLLTSSIRLSRQNWCTETTTEEET